MCNFLKYVLLLILHLVDAQAFPLVLPSRPLLAKGAYSGQKRYTLADLCDLQVRTMLALLLVLLLLMLLLLLLLLTLFHLQAYAEARGVRVVAEIDTPGHAAAWCVGMPQICPGGTLEDPPICPGNLRCSGLDPCEAVLRDLFTVLPDDFVHLAAWTWQLLCAAVELT